MLREKIAAKQAGILTYGMTPPKATHPPEKIAEISQKQLARIQELQIDALILYDVQDEADRIEHERPFPYLPTLDPLTYSETYFQSLPYDQIIYRCVGKYSEDQFADWVKMDNDRDRFAVYVGSSSHSQAVHLDLTRAYELSQHHNDNLTFGGVVIPERHMKKNDEHMRVMSKVQSGCKFFVSQATYDVENSKNFLSEYYYHCMSNGLEMVPILFNLAPCGSPKTLDFMKWLGIRIPSWLENELIYSSDVLDKSIQLTKKIFEEIFEFGLEKGIPIGCSIESVSTRKVEIEASIQLVQDIRAMIDRKLHV
ncbi:methylenetetrahydrofolate reductase [Paenibacillus aestuarii]|uniref:Methylenetetrahydrofolate reductase n=1 Tax=Paenibacillus aestuarii TaxID=516965 RepID=A0ABW0K7H5_9BACL|nr:methylenetetrahydrofolate reductase [Paenibacillus aestuarii]